MDKERPNFACIFVTRHDYKNKYKDKYYYNLWRLEWIPGDDEDDDNTIYYYLAWLDSDGNEWDDISECNYDEYLVLEKLPTLEELKQ